MPADCQLATNFAVLLDPRLDRGKCHDRLAIVTIARCGGVGVGGADAGVVIERFGDTKRSRLPPLVPLPGGIPSPDAAGRVFAAIDGKTARRSHDRAHDRGPVHLVSAWAGANHVVLGQVATENHSNWITGKRLMSDWEESSLAKALTAQRGCPGRIGGWNRMGTAEE